MSGYERIMPALLRHRHMEKPAKEALEDDPAMGACGCGQLRERGCKPGLSVGGEIVGKAG